MARPKPPAYRMCAQMEDEVDVEYKAPASIDLMPGFQSYQPPAPRGSRNERRLALRKANIHAFRIPEINRQVLNAYIHAIAIHHQPTPGANANAREVQAREVECRSEASYNAMCRGVEPPSPPPPDDAENQPQDDQATPPDDAENQPQDDQATPPSPGTAPPPPLPDTNRQDDRTDTATVCSANLAGFAPKRTTHATNNAALAATPQHAPAANDPTDAATLQIDYTLTTKHMAVLDCMSSGTTVVMIQEYNGSEESANALTAHMNTCGVGCFVSLPPRDDRAAGITILWRKDTWSLIEPPTVHVQGRAATIHLLSSIDHLSYKFSNVYAPQRSLSVNTRREFCNKFTDGIATIAHDRPHFVCGDFNGPPLEYSRNTTIDPNTATLTRMEEMCKLTRISPNQDSFFWANKKDTNLREINWPLVKDDAGECESMPSLNPAEKSATIHNIADGKRFILIPASMVDSHFKRRNHPTKTDTLFVTLLPYDTNDRHDEQHDATENGELHLLIEPVIESMPEGMVLRRPTIQWQELYPKETLAPEDDKHLIRVLRRSFNPFAQRYWTDQTINLNELHGVHEDTTAHPPPPHAQEALDTNLRHRNINPKSGSSCIDHAYANDYAKHMTTRCLRGATLGKKLKENSSYHLSTYLSFKLTPKETAPANSMPITKKRIKLNEVTTKLGGWGKMQGRILLSIIDAIDKMAADMQQDPEGQTATNATARLTPDTPPDTQSSAHGHTPQSLTHAAEQYLIRIMSESTTFTDEAEKASDAVPMRPDTAQTIRNIHTIGGIQTINAVFEGAQQAIADALKTDTNEAENEGSNSNRPHKSLAQRTRDRMDVLVQIRGDITVLKKRADTRRADPNLTLNTKAIIYMRHPHTKTPYEHNHVPIPADVQKMWSKATIAPKDVPLQATYQHVYERAVEEEKILTQEIGSLHEKMWATIDQDRSKSQARRLQEILDENEHRNFVVTLWSHWRQVEAEQMITPRRLPLARVIDTEHPDEPPITISDPRYSDTIKRELEGLWAEKPSMSKAINKLVEMTGIPNDALPTPHFLDAVAECTRPSNVRKSINKIRANAATGPDNVHGYCARKGGEPVIALLQLAAMLALLHDNADLDEKDANLALVHKSGRDPNNAAASHRPLVVFNHRQVFFERLLQWIYNKHVDAVRSDSQAAFLANRTTPAINWIQRLSAELAMFAGEERTEASSDAQSFYDKIQLLLQMIVEKHIGIPTHMSERVRHTTATTTLSARTEGGVISDIAVRSGAGQGRSLATAKSQLVLFLRERYAAQTAPGEQFAGHQNTHVQHGNRAFADDESTSMRGPLGNALAELAQEASTIAADVVLGCPNNPTKSIMSHTKRDADDVPIFDSDFPIVLPNGPDRTPVPMEFTTKPQKTVGIYTANGIEHAATDNSRTRTINVFNKKASAQGGIMFPQIKEARRIISLGTNCFKQRPTIAQIDNSHSIDRGALREDVAAGFVHHSTKLCVRHAPPEAYGAGVPNDEATARAAFVDDLLRTLNLPPGVPWRDAMEAYLTKYLWLCGNNDSAPLAFTPPTTRRADAEMLIGPYLYESLEMAGLLLIPSHAPTLGALDPSRAPTREPHLSKATQLWHGIDIRDAHITTSQRLMSLGIRYVEDLIDEVVDESTPDCSTPGNPRYRICNLISSHQAETIFGGSAHGNAPVIFSTADHKTFDQLKRELAQSPTAARALRNYAATHTERPEHLSLALAMNSHLGQRPILIYAYREARPDGAAKTRGVSAETGRDGQWAPTRTANTPTHATCRAQKDSMPQYLTVTAGNLACGSEGQWLTHNEVLQHAENAINALTQLEPTMDHQAIRNTIMDTVEVAMANANKKHTIPGPFYDHAAVNMANENHSDGNIWQRLNSADPKKADKITCAMLSHFQAYAVRKGQPRTTESNGSQTSRTRQTRNHPVPEYQTYARGTRNCYGKQTVGPHASERDIEENLIRFDRMDRSQLLRQEEQQAHTENRTALHHILSTTEDRLFVGDLNHTPNPFYSNPNTRANPITSALTRDPRVEPADPSTAPFWQAQNTNATSTTGDTFRVDVDPDELAGATPAADKELAMVMLAIQHTIGELHLIRFTDGALFPDPNDSTKAKHVGWGMVRAWTRPGTRLDSASKYTGNALTPLATIGRAELSAVIHAMLDLKQYSDDRTRQTQTSAANMIICMDSDSCAMEIENTLRAGDHESLTKCDDAQLIETIDNLRADLHHAGCKVVILKVPGHAKSEFEIDAVTLQAYADATAKAAALQLPLFTDPPMTITRGPFILAAQDAPNHANTDPNDGFSTIASGTRMVKTATQKIQNCLTLRAVRADDAKHDAATGRSAIDRILIGADPKPNPTHTTQRARDAQKRHPPCALKPHSPSSSATMSLPHTRDTNVWRDLVRDMNSGCYVRRPPDCKPCGFAWLGQAIGQGSITYRCKECPACGMRADARHIITNECSYFKIPEEVRNMLRDLLGQKVGAETLMLQFINHPEAHSMASIIQETANTLFGDTPPKRDDNGWCNYTRALRVLGGGLPQPSDALLRQIKDMHDREFDPQQPNNPIRPRMPANPNAPVPPQMLRPATKHGKIAHDKLITMRDDFVTAALQAATLTKTPPRTAPTKEEEPDDEQKFDHDEHFFIPRRPDNATNMYVRNRVMNDLRYIWEILAKMLNEFEQALNIAADDYEKHDGRSKDTVDEDEVYKQGKAKREKTNPTEERSARLENRQIEREVRAHAPPKPKIPPANPRRDYKSAGFGQRRFKGGQAIDKDAEKRLAAANAAGTDGLARNDDTTAVLTALARNNDRYASMQLRIQTQPSPPDNTPRPPPLPRQPPSQYANPTHEAELHQKQQRDANLQPEHKATFGRNWNHQWGLEIWRTLDPEEAQRCPDIISRTNAPTAADDPQTSSNDEPQQPDADILDATKDDFDVVTDSDDEIIDVVTQNGTAGAASADAAPSQHDSAADADDELDATPMHSPRRNEAGKKRKKTRRGIHKKNVYKPDARHRLNKAIKRAEQQPVDPSDERDAKRTRTPDARHPPRPPTPFPPRPSSHQSHAGPSNRPLTPRALKRSTDRELSSPSQRPRSTDTDRPANEHVEEEANGDERPDDEEEQRNHPTAPQSQRPPSNQ